MSKTKNNSKENLSMCDARSLNRPAWTQYDLFAFNNRYSYNKATGKSISTNFYSRRKGL